MKTCPLCKETKPFEGNFYRIKGRGIWSGYCIPCTKAKVIEWQKTNPEKKAAQDRKQDAKPDRQAKHRERGRKHYHANKERERDRLEAWQKANPDRARQRYAAYRHNNPDIYRETQRVYHQTDTYKAVNRMRSKLRAAVNRSPDRKGEKVARAYWQALLREFDHSCCYCDAATDMTLEHLTPLTKGGLNMPGNIAPACWHCNTRKGNKLAEDFATDRAAVIRARSLACA